MLRYLLLMIALLFMHSCKAQNTAINRQTELYIGQSLDFDNTIITLIDVKNDSRCPSDLTCMWSGSVLAIISIQKTGTPTVTKELTFGVNNINPKNPASLFQTKDKTIITHTIKPYPSSKKTFHKKDYYIEVLTQ
ncbi:hypothetical protein ACFSTE_06580 [Aquimarina hainanensis]|uniref:Lipoprotein n=1 Tax=Aquimarina hainanensis TaxID=1578017 RepID=A0ABW5N7B3_9FLAO|nr:hypothetical protein [Aquimarina sp. TRL1]QKX04918.1 hypothetical protein HN014_08290 [Aquimarina sp. TRL1]